MDSEPIMRRIEQLQMQKKKYEELGDANKAEAEKVQGAIDELWRWVESRKDVYGMFVAPGRSRAEIKLPVFGSKEKVAEAIANFRVPRAINGENEAEAKAKRAAKMRDIGQNLVDEIAPMAGDGDD